MLLSLRRKWTQVAVRRATSGKRLLLEQLEDRRLLAGNVTITAVTVPQAVEGLLSDPSLTASFEDTAGPTADQLTATVDYGDGTPLSTTPIITKTGATTYTITDTHTFPEESGSVVPPNAFTVTLHVFETASPDTNTDTKIASAEVLDAPLTPGNPVTPGTPQIFNGVGGTAATALADFEAAIGGANNGANPPTAPLTTGFRDINWDGVKLDGTDFGGPPNTTVINTGHTVGIPLNRFQERGVYFGAVYAVSGSFSATDTSTFADVNPNVSTLFPSFTPKNTFAMFNDNGIDFKFVVPSSHNTTVVSAASRGFGAIFQNVQLADTSSIEYFNGSTSLGKFFVQTGTAGQSEFLGVLFNNPIVTNVVLTLGTDVIFRFDGTTFTPGGVVDDPTGGHNLVVTDDFVYAEPQAIANGFPIVSGAQGTTNAVVTVNATLNTPFTGVVATFSDADPNGNAKDYTATINWGDGHLTNGTITANAQGGFDVSGTNTYTRLGLFPINVDIADFGGGPGAEGSSPTLSVNNTARVTAGDQNQRYVAQLYVDLLQREVDPSGLAFWGGLLDTGMATRAQVVQGIESSLEFRIVEVTNAYQQILNRAPDPGGLNNFVQFITNGGTVEQMKATMLGSPEFDNDAQTLNTTPGLTTPDQKLVDFMFQKVLGRTADPSGLTTFTQELANGVPASTVGLQILTSEEGFQVLVKGFYLKFLHREADSGGLSHFTSALAAGARDEEVILGITASDEYFSLV
jgi:hypothetical protein